MTMSDYEGHRGGSAALAFLVGAVVGAGVALLLAPASGSDTRKKIGRTARRWREDAKDAFEDAIESLEDLKDEARAVVDEGREAVRRARGSHEKSSPSA
jgi:gas vesicle protein